MHDIRWISAHPDLFDDVMRKRGESARAADLLVHDEARRRHITQLQALQEERNQLARDMGAIADKQSAAFQQARVKAIEVKDRIAALEKESYDNSLAAHLATLPNLLASDVPEGANEADNQEVRRWGTLPSFETAARPHEEIGLALNQMDFERSATISGSRFVSLRGDLARMERALQSFMLDNHTTHYGYTEVLPPHLVREATVFAVGQLPKFREDLFATTSGHFLISTAEVPLTTLWMDRIIDPTTLPKRVTGYTPCYRSEAGSAGRDVHGMIRMHQFTKVELVSLTTEEGAHAELERMTEAAESILQRLELPYRVMLLCSGDTGFCSKKTYDLEVWMPSQSTYREISSCSYFGDFIGRRMNCRYKDADGTMRFVHSFNGSGLAIGRTIVAIIENYQQKDGSIRIPAALQPYMGGKELITPCASW